MMNEKLCCAWALFLGVGEFCFCSSTVFACRSWRSLKCRSATWRRHWSLIEPITRSFPQNTLDIQPHNRFFILFVEIRQFVYISLSLCCTNSRGCKIEYVGGSSQYWSYETEANKTNSISQQTPIGYHTTLDDVRLYNVRWFVRTHELSSERYV